jgi:Holliday junction resolvase-like predicted endonuclease
MTTSERPPAGPRGIVGALAEDAAADHLVEQGWTILARNLRVAQDEVDIVALEPGRRPILVVVEVRSRSGVRFGAAVESVDARKVSRLYRAALSLRQGGHRGLPLKITGLPAWRVDLLALRRRPGDDWVVESHLRGLAPP